MKAQEEIIIQAKAYAESIGNEDGTTAYDYVKGYNQCQEDNDWTKNCKCESSIGQTWCCNQCGLPYATRKEQGWTNFEGELMDWSHQLGQEQKYIPFPVQVLEWLKKNYKLPQKK